MVRQDQGKVEQVDDSLEEAAADAAAVASSCSDEASEEFAFDDQQWDDMVDPNSEIAMKRASMLRQLRAEEFDAGLLDDFIVGTNIEI